jgi:hypothetical protein
MNKIRRIEKWLLRTILSDEKNTNSNCTGYLFDTYAIYYGQNSIRF